MAMKLPRPDGSPNLDVPDPELADQERAEQPPTPDPVAALEAAKQALTEEVHLQGAESAELRRQRISTGVLILVVGAVMLLMLRSVSGVAKIALSNANDARQLPTLSLPGFPVVLGCGVLLVACGLAFVAIGKGHRLTKLRTLAAVLAGLATVIGFVTWAAAGRSLPFLVNNQLQGTLLVATPLILGGLCGLMCERAGVVNVSIEGQMLSAAFASAVVGSITQSLLWGVVAGILSAMVMAAVLALFAITYLMDQVVLGVVINLLAAGLTSFLLKGVINPRPEWNGAPVFQRLPIPGLSEIPLLGQVLFNQSVLVYLAVISVAVVWAIFRFTSWGLRVRAVGEHPKAADTVGISVRAVRWSAVLAGAIFSGLGGAYFSLAVAGKFNDDITVGNGFIALAALIMGRWRPWLVALMALFFGFANQLSVEVTTIGAPISSEWLKMLPYLATVIAVAGLIGRVRGPAAAGIPFSK